MSFKAGAIRGEAILDTTKWDRGLKSMSKGTSTFVKFAAGTFVAGMTLSIAAANAFQKEMSNVATVIDTSVISTQEMTKALFKLDPALGSTTEMTQGLYNAFSAGAETMEEAIKITTDSAKFATAALTSNATAVDILTTATNAYGKDVMDTTKASDIFFTTIKQGKITGEQLAGSIGQSIPLYASMNIEMTQLASGMAAMTKQGISANESTTQLNGIVNAFLKPSEAMTASLKEIGFESGAAFIEAEGLTGALEFLEQSTSGNKDELSKLIPNINGLKGAMALTGVGGEEYNKVLQEMEKSTGATDVAFQKQEKTFKTLSNQMGKIAIVSGNVGKHFVDEVAVGATTAAEGVMDFITSSDGMEVVANTAATVAAGFNFLDSILRPMFETLIPVGQDLFASVGETLGEVTERTGESAGAFNLLGGVVQLSTGAIRVAGTVINGWIRTWGDLAGAVNHSASVLEGFFGFLKGENSWDVVKDRATEAGEAFKELGKGAIDFYKDVGGVIKEEVSNFSKESEKIAMNMSDSFNSTFTNMKQNVINNYDEMITGQEDFTGEVVELNDEMNTSIEDSNENLVKSTKSIYQSLKDTIKDFIKEAKFEWEGLYTAITSTAVFGVETLSNLSTMAHENDLAELEASKQQQLEVLQDDFNQGLITQQEYEDQKAVIDEQALQRENELSKKQFESQKKFNIAQAWMDAGTSIMGWWSQAPKLGPIAGPIFAGSMTAASLAVAGAQTSMISEQQYVPAREKGGMASGMTRINEAGGEIVTLPDGSQVIPNDISSQIAGSVGSGESQGVVVNFYDTVVRDNMDIDLIVEKVSRSLGRSVKESA